MALKNHKYLTVRVDDDLLQALAELADQNERSTSSEARVAIRLHLERQGIQTPEKRAHASS